MHALTETIRSHGHSKYLPSLRNSSRRYSASADHSGKPYASIASPSRDCRRAVSAVSTSSGGTCDNVMIGLSTDIAKIVPKSLLDLNQASAGSVHVAAKNHRQSN